MKRLRIYSDLRCLKHQGNEKQAENPDRLTAINEGISTSAILKNAEISTSILCDVSDLELVHTKEYLSYLENQCQNSKFIQSAEIQVSQDSYTAIRLVAGAGMDSVRSAQNDEIDSAFIALRPPGHHAEKDKALGFCFINNIAITAEFAKKLGFRKILIIDWDVHHGNGTQHIFWNDPNVLFISIHEESIYPYMDDKPEHIGGEGALGCNLNIPLKSGSNGFDLRREWEEKLEPLVKKFEPELILVSAGFDGHKDDSIASLEYETTDFGWMTAKVNKLALEFNCKIISFLEGGYNLEALSDSVIVHCETLLKGTTEWTF